MKIIKSNDASKKADALIAVDEIAGAYYAATQQIKKLGEDKDRLKPEIMMKVDLLGVKDEKGSIEMETARFKVVNQKRETVSLNTEKARKLLEKKGLLKQVEKTRIETYFDQEELVRLSSEGKISQAEMRAITDTNTTVALIVKELKHA